MVQLSVLCLRVPIQVCLCTLLASLQIPWSFSVFASLEPDPGQSEEEKREQLMKMPRIQMLQTSTQCLGRQFHDDKSCNVWERCRLKLSATKEVREARPSTLLPCSNCRLLSLRQAASVRYDLLKCFVQLTQECGQHVQSPVPLALDLPQCASTLPPRFTTRKLADELDVCLYQQQSCVVPVGVSWLFGVLSVVSRENCG